MRARKNGMGRRWPGRLGMAPIWLLALLIAVLPRSAGAIVLHAHAGHGLHVHLVPAAASAPLDFAAVHAQFHAHDHPEEQHAFGTSEDDELFLGLPGEPARGPQGREHTVPPEAFLASASIDPEVVGASFACRPRARPPPLRGRVPRSGARALMRRTQSLRC